MNGENETQETVKIGIEEFLEKMISLLVQKMKDQNADVEDIVSSLTRIRSDVYELRDRLDKIENESVEPKVKKEILKPLEE